MQFILIRNHSQKKSVQRTRKKNFGNGIKKSDVKPRQSTKNRFIKFQMLQNE